MRLDRLLADVQAVGDLAVRADRHATYVALSRHRDGVDAYWSTQDFTDRAELHRSLSRPGLKDTTLDYSEYVPPAPTPPEATSPRPRHEREMPEREPLRGPVKPRETYRRDPDARTERRVERAAERERLVAEYRMQGVAGAKAAWALQRVREQEHRATLESALRTERDRLIGKGLAPLVAGALVSVRFASAGGALDDAIRAQRAELRQNVALLPRLTWREFLIARRDVGDIAAERALRGLRYRQGDPMEREPIDPPGIEKDLETVSSPNARMDRTAPPTIEQDQTREPEMNGAPRTRLVYWTLEGGDVAYAFKNDALRRAIFHDRGVELVMKGNSDEAVRAAVRVAREKWGKTITLNGSDAFKERALKWAVAMNVQVTNPELRPRHADLSKTVATVPQREQGQVLQRELGNGKREIDLDL